MTATVNNFTVLWSYEIPLIIDAGYRYIQTVTKTELAQQQTEIHARVYLKVSGVPAKPRADKYGNQDRCATKYIRLSSAGNLVRPTCQVY